MLRTRDQASTLDDTHDEPGDVVLPVGVEAGHLRRLPSEQRALILTTGASHSGHDRLSDGRRQPARAEVVEEEQRLGALNQDVVDAVVDEILSDGVVLAREERDSQLRPDTVCTGHEHGILKLPVVNRNRPPNEPMSDNTFGVNVDLASPRIRRTASLPASISTPDAL